MEQIKCKIGDKVVLTKSDNSYYGKMFEIAHINECGDMCCHALEPISDYTESELINLRREYPRGNWTFSACNLELAKGYKETLVRYMVYGMNCDNKSQLFLTEKELRTDIKECSQKSDWRGRVIGYKLTPLFEAENKVVLNNIKEVK